MFKLVKKKTIKPVTIREHFKRTNQIAIKRRGGGHGDILVQRMLFEDIKKLCPELSITFTCPNAYLHFAKNHPYCQAVSLDNFDERLYGAVYDISTCCRVHECKHGGNNKENRSDIWAKFCGITLENHNMHLQCDEKTKDACLLRILETNFQKKPTVLFVAHSTGDNFGTAKSMTDKQIIEVIETLKNKGYFVYTTHDRKHQIYDDLGVPQFVKESPEKWIGLTAAADYVISVDTGTFHLAAALKKPLVGVFSFTDGKLYGKYYDFILVQKHRDNGNWDCGPCYNMDRCPKSTADHKPCMTELCSTEIIAGFEAALNRWPVLSH